MMSLAELRELVERASREGAADESVVFVFDRCENTHSTVVDYRVEEDGRGVKHLTLVL